MTDSGRPARYDLGSIAATLREGTPSDGYVRAFVEATLADSAWFWGALEDLARSPRMYCSKSRYSSSIDFYHDCVAAHVPGRKAAVVVRENGEQRSVDYPTLHQRSSALLATWQALGVAAGQSIAIVAPAGIEYAVALVTALRIGAIVTCVASHGPTWALARLAALQPDHVVADARLQPALRDLPLLPIAPSARSTAGATSHTYGVSEPAFRLVTPMGPAAFEVFELTAGHVHQALVRDALYVYALGPDDALAAPGFEDQQWQPLLLLTTLLAGATWLEADARELESDVGSVGQLRPTILGVSRQLRDRLLNRGLGSLGGGVRAWFRSLTEAGDPAAWHAFAAAASSRRMHGFAVLANAASAGAQLFCPRSTLPPDQRVWPVPGGAFQLSEVAGGALPALDERGVYTRLADGEPDGSLGRFIVARSGDSYLLAGSLDSGPHGLAYPAGEVAACVKRGHSSISYAAAFTVPGGPGGDVSAILVAFYDPTRASGPPTLRDLERIVAREMGARWLPARLEVYPLRPRLIDGEVDVPWCRSQYLSGSLHRKAKLGLFRDLSALSYMLAPSEEGA
jgi:hypothetical protein